MGTLSTKERDQLHEQAKLLYQRQQVALCDTDEQDFGKTFAAKTPHFKDLNDEGNVHSYRFGWSVCRSGEETC